MIKIISDVQTKDNQMKQVEKALKELANKEVLIGIPEEHNLRQDGEITNAELMYIHSNGSPINNIPARPVIEPAIEDDKEEISSILKEASDKAIKGDIAGMEKALTKAGLRGEKVSKDWFENPKNGWAENNLQTIKQKGSSAPLIDTAELRKSITHVVRDK